MAQDSARLFEQTETIGDLKALEASLREATAPAAKSETGGEKDEGVKLPKKLQGKSYEEVIEMYQNLESAFGRMANDLGTQRKFTDQLLELKRASDLKSGGAPAEEKPRKVDIKAADLLERPGEVLERELSARDEMLTRKVEERLASLNAANKEQQFLAKHPDVQETTQSEDFRSWLEESPVRKRAATLVSQTGDYEIADELLSEYKAARTSKRSGDDTTGARSASLEGKSPSRKSSSGGKRYRRAELIELRVRNPHLYEQMADEITRAYAEGRVD